MSLPKAVCAIVINEKGEFLCVSRKTDHSDFGAVGGKVDPEDNDDCELAMVREAGEETGLGLHNLKLVDTREWGTYLQHCFTADYRGDVSYDEPHVVKWGTAQDLMDGSFGEYNEMILRKLNLI